MKMLSLTRTVEGFGRWIVGNPKADAAEHRTENDSRTTNFYEVQSLVEQNEGAAFAVVVTEFISRFADLRADTDMRIECSPA